MRVLAAFPISILLCAGLLAGGLPAVGWAQDYPPLGPLPELEAPNPAAVALGRRQVAVHVCKLKLVLKVGNSTKPPNDYP